ncbi:MAG: hypothetical protein NXI32_11455 [bacterium]|nr:hypothetical protein [bacterium]
MGYWKNKAEKYDSDYRDHAWHGLFIRTLANVDEELHNELSDEGELDAWATVHVAETLFLVREMTERGMDEATAKEQALSAVLPQPEVEPAEDYELEGAAEDEAAQLADWLEYQFG